MVGLLGCGCCSDSGFSYCDDGVSTTGDLSDGFQTPFLNNNLPPSGPWTTFRSRFGSLTTTWEGWFQWRQTGAAQPWEYAVTEGKFRAFTLRRQDDWIAGVARGYWIVDGFRGATSDICVYSANYRVAKYKTEIDVSLPLSGVPILRNVDFYTNEPSRIGPSFWLKGVWADERESSSLGGRLFGPTLVVGLQRLTPTSQFTHYWCVVDKYTSNSDSAYGSYTAGPVNYLASKSTYKLGIETECINLQDYGTLPGPIFRCKAFIDDVQVYTNTYGPFIDNSCVLVGGINNWRPNGFCRCMLAGSVGGAGQLHASATFQPISRVQLWASDLTKSFWADNFRLTETAL